MRGTSIFVAILALAVPTMATVTITVVDKTFGIGEIHYRTTGEKVRAFALDITVDSGAVITAVGGYKKGPSVAPNNLGYGIFPANFARYITVNATTGEVTTWDANNYTPVAGPNDVGALKGIGTNGVTIEMASLYYPANDDSPNAPPNAGTLCTIKVDKECTATIALNAARGGVVLTDPTQSPEVKLVSGPISLFVETCFGWYCPEWIRVGMPGCWVYTQCHGDADGQAQGSGKTGFVRVGTNDLNVLIQAFGVREAPFGLGIASVQNGICADFDRRQQGNAKTGYMRVGTNDLNILINNWLVKEPPQGPGTRANCNNLDPPPLPW